MRAPALLLALLPLAGCGGELLGPAAVVNGISLMTAGRAVPDLVVSAITGQDCSIAHRDLWEPYCRPRVEATPEAPLCTRSLGSVDCWRQPPAAMPAYRGLADGPPPRPAQRWPAGELGFGS